MVRQRCDDEADIIVDGDGSRHGKPVGIAGSVDFNRIAGTTCKCCIARGSQRADRIAGRKRATRADGQTADAAGTTKRRSAADRNSA